MRQWIKTNISHAAVTAVIVWVSQLYLTGRMQEHFDQKLEALKPTTAEQVLKRENFVNSKRAAYFEALEVLSRYHESIPWLGPDIPKDRVIANHRPTEAEVNIALAKLSMFTDDPDIPQAFLNCFGRATSVDIGKFVSLLRKDLGYGPLPFKSEDYKRYFSRNPKGLAR